MKVEVLMAKSFNNFKKDAKKDVKIATHDKPLFKSVPATGVRGDQPASDLLIRTMRGLTTPSSPSKPVG